MNPRDRGAAVVWSLALLSVLMMAALVAAALAALAVARQSADTAADVAALAAAQAIGDPCAAAGEAAARNGTTLVSCVLESPDVRVEVTAPAPDPLLRLMALLGHDAASVVGRARAGPVTTTP